MEKLPLLMFNEPVWDIKDKRPGFSKIIPPPHARMVERLNPKFDLIKNDFSAKNSYYQKYEQDVDPSYVLVFEFATDPKNLQTVIKTINKDTSTFECLVEFIGQESYESDDFCNKDKHPISITTKCIGVFTNQEALNQILDNWDKYQRNENCGFKRGLSQFKALFKFLIDVHIWGIKERTEETGVIEYLKNEIADEVQDIKIQIDLFFRNSKENRDKNEEIIKKIITYANGEVLNISCIEEIRHHSILAKIPNAYAQEFISNSSLDLINAVPVMYIKAAPQSIKPYSTETLETGEPYTTPKNIIKEPIIALFDGLPQTNHCLLKDMIQLDDPDDYEDNYLVKARSHGTAMASLILRGQDLLNTKDEVRQIYVRPVMKGFDIYGNSDQFEEGFLDSESIVDTIHRAVLRLFEETAGKVAPTVKIINLSIGLEEKQLKNSISPLAKLLDYLSYKYRVLFIVSAGNELNVDFDSFEMTFDDLNKLSTDDKNRAVLKYLKFHKDKQKLLSPADSINALTVGALYSDNFDAKPLRSDETYLCDKGMPALYGRYSGSINASIKPEIFYDGGRKFVKEIYPSHGFKWALYSGRAPGIRVAAPTDNVTTHTTCYEFGTSDSAALASNKAEECYEILRELFKLNHKDLPSEYVAVLIKAMLVHGAYWGELGGLINKTLKLNKSQISKYIGYGVPNFDEVMHCTEDSVTLVGYGDIKQDKAVVYKFPLPMDFSKKTYKRQFTVTLAYFTPIKPSTNKYRGKKLWVSLSEDGSGTNDGNTSKIFGDRINVDSNSSQRGTVQHEVFESAKAHVWDDDKAVYLKVNCKDDAINDTEQAVPYALFATFKLKEANDINIYQRVKNKLQIATKIANVVAPIKN